MKKPKVYLAGAMSNKSFEQMNSWRIEATNLLNRYLDNHCIIINPVEYFPLPNQPNPIYELEAMKFDLNQVRNSDLILVKLENSIGTAIELYEATEYTKIPVIGYLATDNLHPWESILSTKITNTLEEAVDYAFHYYLKNM